MRHRGDTSERLRKVIYAVEDSFGDVSNHTLLMGLEELGTAMRLSCPNGRGGELTADVQTTEDAIEIARAWVVELGIDARGSLRPVPGMLATRHIGGDSYACTVDRVSESGKTCWIGGKQASRGKDGGWRTGKSYYYTIGVAEKYLDPHF